jgi:putative SOS response-associated peptidase YedK
MCRSPDKPHKRHSLAEDAQLFHRFFTVDVQIGKLQPGAWHILLRAMCGRYSLSATDDELEEFFDYVHQDQPASRHYNIAPTASVPIIRLVHGGDERELVHLRWGFPAPASRKSGGVLINARAETAAEKRVFRESLERRRCLVPADGFYEWRRGGRVRQPYRFSHRHQRFFAFAGLWDRFEGPSGGIDAFVILTTAPNELLAPIHDRMPAILDPTGYAVWLSWEAAESARASLAPFPAGSLRCYPVTTKVNAVSFDDPACFAPAAEVEPRLF